MAKISFVKAISPVLTEKHTNLLEALQKAQVPVGSSCGGEGICNKCLVRVVSGSHQLTPPNDTEERLRSTYHFTTEWRVSCQTQILGDITIDTDYW